MAANYFLLPRMKRDNTSNTSLFKNNAEEELYNYHNTSNFSNDEIQAIYDAYKEYLPDLVFYEHIYNSPPHKDMYMPTLYEYTPGKYVIQIPQRIAGAPAYWPKSYSTTYTPIICPNNYFNISTVDKVLNPLNLYGIMFNTKLILSSTKNKLLITIGASNSSFRNGIQIFLIDNKIYIVIKRLYFKNNEFLSSRCYVSNSSLPTNHNSLEINISLDKTNIGAAVRTGINGGSYQNFCSFDVDINGGNSGFFSNFYYSNIYTTTMDYSEYTSVQGNQSISNLFDSNLNKLDNNNTYHEDFISIGPSYQVPYEFNNNTNYQMIGSTDPNFVGDDYYTAYLMRNTTYDYEFTEKTSEILTNMTGYSSTSNSDDLVFNMPYDKGTIDDIDQIDKIYIDELKLYEKVDVRAIDINEDLPTSIEVEADQTEANKDLSGQLYISGYGSIHDMPGILNVYKEPTDIQVGIPIVLTVPEPTVDLHGQLNIHKLTHYDFSIDFDVPKPEIELPGNLFIQIPLDKDLFKINIRVPVNVRPTPYGPITGNLIVEIPFPYTQFKDMEFFLTQVKYPQGQKPANFLLDLQMFATSSDNLFIPQRYYTRYDENHILISNDLGLQEGDEVRFTFCHNDGKYHVKKLEFYFEAKGNASYYFLDLISPYKKDISNSQMKFKVFVNRKEIVMNKDFVIDDEQGTLEFVNDEIANNQGDKIDLLCFYTGIDDTAVADLPMSGYIYLKRNMIDRNYNNNMMATFINGKLVPRDKILKISNNIYKVKEDIQTRHDLQVLNMSNRINSLVPFYKQSTQYPEDDKLLLHHKQIVDDFHPRYIECDFPIQIGVHAPSGYNRQHFYSYHNPVFFDPKFLLENKDNWISFIHLNNPANYTLNFYKNDYDVSPSAMQLKLELHIKTPFEDRKEESRSAILFYYIPATVTNSVGDYCLAAIKIKQIINLDVWNKDFLGMCDGITLRIEPERTLQDDPSEVYFNLTADRFETYTDGEQLNIFEYRVSTSYDGGGQILYSKYVSFNPEEINKQEIRESIN